MKMTTGLAVGIGVGPFATKQPEGSSSALDVITSSNGAWWVVKERDGSNNLVDQTGGGRHLLLPGGSANPVLLDHTGTDYFWFPGTTGNNLSIAGLSNSTTYDYTVTYSDTTTNTGSETTDGSGNLVFGNTQTNFNLKKVTKIEVEPSGGGALVADVRATSADPDATTFAELISALTVTINRSSTGYPTEVVDQPQYTFATDDYIEAAASSGFWNVSSAEDMTAVVVFRQHGHTAVDATFMAARVGGNDGWAVQQNTNRPGRATLDSAPAYLTDDTGGYTFSTLSSVAMRVDRSANELECFVGGTGSGTPADITGVGDSSPSVALSVGRPTATAAAYQTFVLVGAAFIKGTAWSAAEISDIADALITANGGTP